MHKYNTILKSSNQSPPFVWFLCFALAISTTLLMATVNRPAVSLVSVNEGLGSISKSAYANGAAKCNAIRAKSAGIPKDDVASAGIRTRNPRISVGGSPKAGPVLIKNASLWDGDGTLYPAYDILLEDGLVKSVGKDLQVTLNTITINANGRYVTPGIVDMHSHAGLDSWPETSGGSDTNEMSGLPVHPELRSLDGFDPWDIALSIINSGGVTTSLILPGSGNIMGGEAYAIKHRPTPSNRAEHMLLNAGMNSTSDGHAWRWMKMACGENAIMSSRDKELLPESRLGEGFLFRRRINDAYQVKLQQDEWCLLEEAASNLHKDRAHLSMNTVFPEKIDQESLIALLRGDILLNAHCYETYDLEMMIRLTKEFGFKITAFHHALEAWEVADLLAEEDIAVAIFADHWGFKKEAYDASVNGAKLLAKAGVKIAFKSDHPVLNAQNLVFEASKAVHYGFPQNLAIASVTSVPAKLMGQDFRIGYLKAGFDADLVLWDKNPLELGAHPLLVYVDGYQTFEHVDFKDTITKSFTPKAVVAPIQGPTIAKPTGSVITYKNIGALIHSENAVESSQPQKIVTENGNVVCLGSSCADKGNLVDLKGGYVIPGIIAGDVRLGLEEISSEPTTSAGSVDDGKSYLALNGLQLGLKFSKALRAAFKAGVTTAVASLKHRGVVGGKSTAFRTGSAVLDNDAIVKRMVGQNFVIGNTGKKSGASNSVPGQFELIGNGDFFADSIIFDVDSSSQMYPIIDPEGTLSSKNMPHWRTYVLLGGAEAHAIAPSLANANVSVVLSPTRCTPNNWYNRDCLVASSSPSAYQKLRDAGVNVAISAREDNFIRGLIWEAGWLVADLKEFPLMSNFERAREAAGLLTWNVATAYRLEDTVGTIRVGKRANFVVFDGVPGTLEAKVRLVVDGNLIEENTEQF